MNQRGFRCQNDSCLVVIYDFALFSHCFVSSWGQRLCQIHVTLLHRIWLEWIVRIPSKYVCVFPQNMDVLPFGRCIFFRNILFIYWGAEEEEGADSPLRREPSAGLELYPRPPRSWPEQMLNGLRHADAPGRCIFPLRGQLASKRKTSPYQEEERGRPCSSSCTPLY